MDLVRYESANRVATITMDRSAKHNALNNPLCDALRQAWLRFRDSEDRVAVLAAAEEAYFSVGADVGDLPVNMWHAVPGLGVGRRPGFPRQAQAGVQGEVGLRRVAAISPSLRATGSRERAPDDRLREAIQSSKGSLDCFVAALLAMTVDRPYTNTVWSIGPFGTT
jgi:hypothetical protein